MTLIKELPPYIARQAVKDYFPGVISERTLACLASQGEGPPFKRWGKKSSIRPTTSSNG